MDSGSAPVIACAGQAPSSDITFIDEVAQPLLRADGDDLSAESELLDGFAKTTASALVRGARSLSL